jgi:hypothetical protein
MKTILRVALSAMFMLLPGGIHAETAVQSKPIQTDYLNSIKITFLSWSTGSTKISYERALPNLNQSSEICGSLICAGYDKYDNNPLGFTVRYGHKFFFGEREYSLKGFYLRPELIYSYYHYNCTSTGLHNCKASNAREKAAMCALLGTAGYQYIYKRFLADFWFGAGYAYGNPADTGYHHGFQLWDYLGTSHDNIALSFTIRLGFCF